MSAFMCTNKHINIIVNGVLDGDSHLTIYHHRVYYTMDAQQIGNLLTQTNIDSIKTRYNDTPNQLFKSKGDTAGPVETIKLCLSFAYQADESDTWNDSLAKAVIQMCIERQCHKLHGYKDSPWSV